MRQTDGGDRDIQRDPAEAAFLVAGFRPGGKLDDGCGNEQREAAAAARLRHDPANPLFDVKPTEAAHKRGFRPADARRAQARCPLGSASGRLEAAGSPHGFIT